MNGAHRPFRKIQIVERCLLRWRYSEVMLQMSNEPCDHGQRDAFACAEHKFAFHCIQRKSIHNNNTIRTY